MGGGRFSKAFFLFAVSLVLSVLVGSLALTFAPAYAYAQEQTGEATTEVYLVKDSSGDSGNTDSGNTTPESSTTTITTTTDTPSSSSTTKTGDTTPAIPFVIAGIAAIAVITTIAIKKHTANKTIGGDNL